MKKLLPLIIAIAVFAISCSDKRTEYKEAIVAVEHEMENAQSPKVDTVLANRAIQAYANYYTAFPEDSVSVEYKFRASQIMYSIQLYEDGIDMLDELIGSEIIWDDKRALVMLFKAFTYETGIHNFSEAEKAYKALISAYPDHEFANQARTSIEMLGLSGEALTNKLKEINGEEVEIAE